MKTLKQQGFLKVGLLGMTLICLAACTQSPGIASAGPHDPPPPLGPVLITDGALAEGELPMLLVRGALQAEGDQIISDFNADSAHSLSWSSGHRPIDCGYECVGPPHISATRHLGRPNQYVAEIRAHFQFNLDINNNPFDRTIRANLTIEVVCNGWQSGNGEVSVLTQSDPPYVVDDGGPLEAIIDFLLPGSLSSSITARVEAALPPGGSGHADFSSSCRSLGVNSNYGSGAWRFDSVFWQEPEEDALAIIGPPLVELPSERISISFTAIERNSTITLLDTSADLYFDIYVNGVLIPVPMFGTTALAPGEILSLDETVLRVPAINLDDLQIIFADSLGGSGWVMFARSEDFGEGTHILSTHRTEIQPVDLFPPAGFGGPRKPVPIDLHEFELTFEITYLPEPVFQDGGN